MKAVLGGLLGFALYGFAAAASAQQADNAAVGAGSAASPAPLAPPRSVKVAPQEREILRLGKRHWYGWQVVAIDGAATALGITALAFKGGDSPNNWGDVAPVLLFGSVVSYGAGGAVVHLAHGQYWQALASLGLRAGLPITGGVLGLALATCPPRSGDYGSCGLNDLLVGAAAGAVLAMVLDSSLLSWERRTSDEDQPARLGLAPMMASDGRRELRLFGSF